MTPLSGVRILIVDNDPPSSCDLRLRLTQNGASVHVVSSIAAAVLMTNRNRIDVAFVPYDHGDNVARLRDLLQARSIPQIVTGWHTTPRVQYRTSELAAVSF
jgi:DNA-binding response OmpR family regulator